MTTDAATGATSELGLETRAETQIVRVITAVFGVAAVVFFALALGPIVEQSRFLSFLPLGIMIAVVFGLPIVIAIASPLLPLRALRAVHGLYSLAYSAVLIAWVPALTEYPMPLEASPWPLGVLALGTVSAALAWRATIAWMLLIVNSALLGAVRYYAAGEVSTGLPLQDAIYSVAFSATSPPLRWWPSEARENSTESPHSSAQRQRESHPLPPAFGSSGDWTPLCTTKSCRCCISLRRAAASWRRPFAPRRREPWRKSRASRPTRRRAAHRTRPATSARGFDRPLRVSTTVCASASPGHARRASVRMSLRHSLMPRARPYGTVSSTPNPGHATCNAAFNSRCQKRQSPFESSTTGSGSTRAQSCRSAWGFC